jgi:hypothetical protein
MPDEIDIFNRYGVALHGDKLVFLNPPYPREPLSRADALVLAAWLVALADPSQDKFPKVLEAVCNT